jgi:hypothetical protein
VAGPATVSQPDDQRSRHAVADRLAVDGGHRRDPADGGRDQNLGGPAQVVGRQPPSSTDWPAWRANSILVRPAVLASVPVAGISHRPSTQVNTLYPGPSVMAPDRSRSATRSAAVRLAASLRRSYLPLQGPPGTGKTYTATEQILALVAQGRAADITGCSHAVIHQLIDTLCNRASARSATLPIGQRTDGTTRSCTIRPPA